MSRVFKRFSPFTINLFIESLGYLVVIVVAALYREYLLKHLALVLLGLVVLLAWGVFWKRKNLSLMAKTSAKKGKE